MLFQRVCQLCSGRAEARAPLCSACLARLHSGRLTEPLDPPVGLDSLVALHRYRSEVPSLVLAAKNGDRRSLLRLWGRWLAEHLVGQLAGELVGHQDVVTWVPASRAGARRRGYDQGRYLARAVAGAAGLPARRLLVRRPGQAQAGSGREQRLVGPLVRAPVPVPARVLLVDDVVTTGASMTASAQALRQAGARSVVGLAVAVAPDRPRRKRAGLGGVRAADLG